MPTDTTRHRQRNLCTRPARHCNWLARYRLAEVYNPTTDTATFGTNRRCRKYQDTKFVPRCNWLTHSHLAGVYNHLTTDTAASGTNRRHSLTYPNTKPVRSDTSQWTFGRPYRYRCTVNRSGCTRHYTSNYRCRSCCHWKDNTYRWSVCKTSYQGTSTGRSRRWCRSLRDTGTFDTNHRRHKNLYTRLARRYSFRVLFPRR